MKVDSNILSKETTSSEIQAVSTVIYIALYVYHFFFDYLKFMKVVTLRLCHMLQSCTCANRRAIALAMPTNCIGFCRRKF